MAHSLSAQKRIRQNAKHRARNRWRKRTFREMVKDYREALLHGSIDDCEGRLKAIYKKLDQVAAAGTIHRNAASRYKSRLALRLNHRKAAETAAAPTA